MKKVELLSTVVAALAVIMENKVKANVQDEINAKLAEMLGPKSPGASVNIEDVVKRDASGYVTELLCAVSGKFLPATLDYFYEDKSGKSQFTDANGVALRRLSRQAEGIRKVFTKQISASEKAILEDALSGAITQAEGQAKLAELRVATPDYSTVSAIISE